LEGFFRRFADSDLTACGSRKALLRSPARNRKTGEEAPVPAVEAKNSYLALLYKR
jgi:hypothetical protein